MDYSDSSTPTEQDTEDETEDRISYMLNYLKGSRKYANLMLANLLLLIVII
jgi:hypothetical protein